MDIEEDRAPLCMSYKDLRLCLAASMAYAYAMWKLDTKQREPFWDSVAYRIGLLGLPYNMEARHKGCASAASAYVQRNYPGPGDLIKTFEQLVSWWLSEERMREHRLCLPQVMGTLAHCLSVSWSKDNSVIRVFNKRTVTAFSGLCIGYLPSKHPELCHIPDWEMAQRMKI